MLPRSLFFAWARLRHAFPGALDGIEGSRFGYLRPQDQWLRRWSGCEAQERQRDRLQAPDLDCSPHVPTRGTGQARVHERTC